MKLERLGWNVGFAEQAEPFINMGHTMGRVVLEHKHLYTILTENGERLAEVSGKLRFHAGGREDYPAVGDWVAVSERNEEGKATIHGVLPRKSKFSRKMAGNAVEEQIVAANIDTVFLVNALNNDFNPRRIERYLLLAWESGAQPVIVLSKADLCDDLSGKLAEVEAVALGVPIHAVSSAEGDGLEALAPYMQEGQTLALLGSSGVGKSTLLNRLMGGEVQKVNEVRAGDDRGKHTTTHRELFVLPGGSLVIDTPGMRELQLWNADEGLSGTFADVEELAGQCRFADCGHSKEAGCAVKGALADGSLQRDRYDSYLKLQKELAYLARKEDVKLRSEEKAKWKKIHKEAKRRTR